MISKILVVEDDQGLQNLLKEVLTEFGYATHIESDGSTALQYLKKEPPSLVILDLGLPTLGGETVCLEIRKKYPQLPVIILTARDTTSDVVRGFNLGADDYISKPFETDELIARIKARLRQTPEAQVKLRIADLEVDTESLIVRRGNRSISLTPKEFQLLQYLMTNKGRVLTRDMILNRIWLYSPDIETRVVDVYMGYLRKKIDAGFEKKLLQSVRGFGYVIKE